MCDCNCSCNTPKKDELEWGVDWTNVDPVYGPARGPGVPNRPENPIDER